MIHRMIDWIEKVDNPFAGDYGGIVCGVERAEGIQTSIMASGYDCPDCLRLTPIRQRAASISRVLADVRRYGPQEAVAPLEQAYAILRAEGAANPAVR